MKILRTYFFFAFSVGILLLFGCEKDEPITTEPMIQQPVYDLLLDSINTELAANYSGTTYLWSIDQMLIQTRDTIDDREMPNYNFRETEYEGSYQLFVDTTAVWPGIYTSELSSDTIRMTWWQGSLSDSYTFYRREKKFVTRFSSSHGRSTRTSVYYAH